jgi:hypothetical protein
MFDVSLRFLSNFDAKYFVKSGIDVSIRNSISKFRIR